MIVIVRMCRAGRLERRKRTWCDCAHLADRRMLSGTVLRGVRGARVVEEKKRRVVR
jgi:hypothetical protein